MYKDQDKLYIQHNIIYKNIILCSCTHLSTCISCNPKIDNGEQTIKKPLIKLEFWCTAVVCCSIYTQIVEAGGGGGRGIKSAYSICVTPCIELYQHMWFWSVWIKPFCMVIRTTNKSACTCSDPSEKKTTKYVFLSVCKIHILLRTYYFVVEFGTKLIKVLQF